MLVLVAAALGLGSVPAAAAPTAVSAQLSPATHGGGGFGRRVQFVSVRLDAAGGRADLIATLTTPCSGVRASLFDNVRLSGLPVTGGRFDGLSTFAETVAPGIPGIGGLVRTGGVSASAQVRLDGGIGGVIRVRSALRDPLTGLTRGSCDTGTVRWEARVPPPRVGSGRPRRRRATSLRGLTAQGQPFLLRTSRRGRTVDRAGMTLLVTCPSAVGRPLELVAAGMRIRRGRFRATGRFTRSFASPQVGGLRERYRWRLSGRLGARGAVGTWRVRGIVRRAKGGRQVGSCDTGRNRWSAVG